MVVCSPSKILYPERPRTHRTRSFHGDISHAFTIKGRYKHIRKYHEEWSERLPEKFAKREKFHDPEAASYGFRRGFDHGEWGCRAGGGGALGSGLRGRCP